MGEDMKMDKEYKQSPGRPVTPGVRESTAVYDHSRTAGQEMLGKYVVIEPEKVLGFIENHKFLNDLLLQAVQEIKVYFPSSELFLEVKSDVENREDTKLVLSICPDSSPKEAHSKLKQLRKAWWFDASDSSNDKLAINLRYR
jgi:hypothetical protein